MELAADHETETEEAAIASVPDGVVISINIRHHLSQIGRALSELVATWIYQIAGLKLVSIILRISSHWAVAGGLAAVEAKCEGLLEYKAACRERSVGNSQVGSTIAIDINNSVIGVEVPVAGSTPAMLVGNGLTTTVPYDCDAPASAAAPANPVRMLFFLMRAVLSGFTVSRQRKLSCLLQIVRHAIFQPGIGLTSGAAGSITALRVRAKAGGRPREPSTQLAGFRPEMR